MVTISQSANVENANNGTVNNWQERQSSEECNTMCRVEDFNVPKVVKKNTTSNTKYVYFNLKTTRGSNFFEYHVLQMTTIEPDILFESSTHVFKNSFTKQLRKRADFDSNIYFSSITLL